ncbi:ShlB/FhaC/HecB family hemolysin secretion/activation protein [Pandoraea fibrosis]|uniref:ShlB/FhaC/HecB family hemolysin secretion/activation protein n=1 Tax=Pandoraea fibrosis TaxID=1891094 RepID=A0ABX6HYR8_9BURK|nr:ShlB/FhaC/HecB family hemolysin secretion/activation protein [Pandoraea fibrosis]QHE95131.1 ShlB/FhaC/HecB family hemolysin secretion/activation protein [Pandoraea fibrosis]QHF15599.1 ShlB/FhaC/HecB family hemolysin secretion/activation protein [Pandoraea fibrosis]
MTFASRWSTAQLRRLALALLSLPLSFEATAQTSPAPAIDAAASNARQQQLLEQQRQAQERAAAINTPTVRSALPAADGFPALPVESPCFPIERFSLHVPETLPQRAQAAGASLLPFDPFAFATDWLAHYQGECVGREGIAAITAGLTKAILAKGYVTTRVLVPEQDLTTGELKLMLVPGIIGDIRFSDASQYGTWRTAFPTRPGDLLELRDLEQGLEQMKRVASQDVTMQIVPTEVPGESDVVIDIKRTKRWSVVASVDNSGSRDTGKLQGSLALGIDNPLGLNDILNVGATHDLSFADKRFGSNGWNAFYSIPWGFWTATVAAYANRYNQQIAGVNDTFVTRGQSQNLDLRLSRVLQRSQSNVLSAHVRLSKRFGRSFLEDAEIDQQYRNNTFIEFGISDRHYIGAGQFDGTLAYRQSVSGLGAAPDNALPGTPTYRFKMAVLDANLSLPLGQLPLRYVTTFHGQFTNDVLHYIDDMSIGSRYTVRGFDGESSLAAEKGIYWRNELQWALGASGVSLFAGVDYGRVSGPNAQYLAGTQLAGAVIGVRGNTKLPFGFVAGEVFFGTPIYKPTSFQTAHTTVGFSLTAQF